MSGWILEQAREIARIIATSSKNRSLQMTMIGALNSSHESQIQKFGLMLQYTVVNRKKVGLSTDNYVAEFK